MLTLCSCSSNNDTTDNSLENIYKKGVLTVGLDDSFPPMGYMDKNNGELIGFDVDLAKEVASRLGVEIKFQTIDWQIKELELTGGNIDCIWNGLSKTQALDNTLGLSRPYMNNNQCILVRNDSCLKHIQDLDGKTLCVQTESSAEHALDKRPDITNSVGEILTIDTYTKAIFELNNSTVDAIAMDEVIARFYISQNPNAYRLITDNDEEAFSLAQEEYVIGFRKNDNKLRTAIEDTLKAMDNDGTVSAISEKWFAKDITCIAKW